MMKGLKEGRKRPRDTPVIAAAALITVFRDNYELARRVRYLSRCALCRSSSLVPDSPSHTHTHASPLISARGAVADTRDRVYAEYWVCACAQATDVSKAADAVFVMLMLSLLTAQCAQHPYTPCRCVEWNKFLVLPL